MKTTIAMKRKKAAEELAKRKNKDITEDSYMEAKSLMNAYYRFCGLCERQSRLDNDERTCNSKRLEKLEEKIDRTLERLKDRFAEYNVDIVFFSCTPTLCEKGTTRMLYLEHFYD